MMELTLMDKSIWFLLANLKNKNKNKSLKNYSQQ